VTLKEKMHNLNRQPARYYRNHLCPYNDEVVQSIVYLNLRVACMTSLTVP